MREEVHIPFLGAVVQALRALVLVVTLSIRRVNRDEEVILKFGGDDAPFLVVFFDAETELHGKRRRFTNDRGARVALFLCAVPVSVRVAYKCEAID